MVVDTGLAANVDFNQGITSFASNTSSTSGLETDDWFVHVQSLRLMYVREAGYDQCVSGLFNSPSVTHNYLNGHYTVQSSDKILSGFAFSGNMFQPHQLKLLSFAPSGGLGVSGVLETSTVGMIRRKVRKNAAGKIEEFIGNCNEEGNIVFGRQAGEYKSEFDTSATINSKLWEVFNTLPDVCESFMPEIVYI